MVESILWMLIYIAAVVGLAYLVIWVLTQLGVAIPPMPLKALWVIVVLLILLIVWRTIGPMIGSGHLLR